MSQRRTARLGVSLLPPRGNAGWRLVWRVPGSTKRHSRTLSADEARTAKTRRAAQREQAETLRDLKLDHKRSARALVDGSISVQAAMARALDRPMNPRTRLVYQRVAALFTELHGKVLLRDLSRAHLQGFALARMKAPSARDGAVRSPHTTNKELRSLASLLGALRKGGMLRLTREDIGEALENQPADVELKPFLAADKARELLRFAQTQDAKRTHKPITPLLRAVILTGARIDELVRLRWEHVRGAQIEIPANVAKGGRARIVDLAVSPTALPIRKENASGSIFSFTLGEVNAARKRLIRSGAPRFTFHALRRTTGTYLTCAPSIYGAASVFMCARRLGHSVQIAERHYLGVVTGIDPEAHTLEAALELEGWREDALRRRLTEGLAASTELAREAIAKVERESSANRQTLDAQFNELVHRQRKE